MVYIGAVNSQHLSVGKAMMRAGKPILCEKPLCVNVKEVKEMIKVAKEQKVFMMEVRENVYILCTESIIISLVLYFEHTIE